jgi:hypothetical protein
MPSDNDIAICPICGKSILECTHSIVEIRLHLEAVNNPGKAYDRLSKKLARFEEQLNEFKETCSKGAEPTRPKEQEPKNLSVEYRGGRTEYIHKRVVFSAIEGPFFLVQTMNGDRYWHRVEDIQTITELHHWQVM